jgi:serine/threonine-protein kinase
MPERFGRYKVLEELGRGGMAVVYLAEDPGMRRVAIKVLGAQLLADPGFRARFEREARLIGSLEHHAVVPLYDHGQHEDQPYLVFRYMEGGSLADRLSRGRLDEPETARIIARVAEALDYAHGRNIVHRDVKPANILFDGHGQAFLGDFGVARMVGEAGISATSATIGTPGYMSPEQVRGEGATPASDTYALGCTAYEMLAGRTPFVAEDAVGMLMKRLQEDAPQIESTSREINAAIRRAMARNTGQRWPRAGDFAAELARWSERVPVLAPPVAPPLPLEVRMPTPARQQRPTQVAPETQEWGVHQAQGHRRRTRRALGLSFAAGLAAVLGIVIAVAALAGGGGGDDDEEQVAPGGETEAAGLETSSAGGPSETSGSPNVTSTQTPTRTPSPTLPRSTTATRTTAPTRTASPTPTTDAEDSVSGSESLSITTGLPFEGDAGQGGLQVAVSWPFGPIDGAYFEVYTSRLDVQGVPVVDRRITGSSTDNTGTRLFELAPGTYIVTADLVGYNWGSLRDREGVHSVVVEAGRTTRLEIRYGSLTFSAATPGRGIDGQYFEVWFETTDVNGDLVRGGRVMGTSTTNTGSRAVALVPGSYILTSDFRGYNWGSLKEAEGETGIVVSPGGNTDVVVELGTLVVPAGQDVYVELFFQGVGSTGGPVRGSRVDGGGTDNGGFWSSTVTPGTYVVRFRDVDYFDIVVKPGEVTEFRP